jgi:hypothetical protein
MAEDRGKQAFRVRARQGEFIGMTYARRFDLDHDFTLAGAFKLNGRDLEWFAGSGGDGGANIHGESLLRLKASTICISGPIARRI